jgi:hypothetical protein
MACVSLPVDNSIALVISSPCNQYLIYSEFQNVKYYTSNRKLTKKAYVNYSLGSFSFYMEGWKQFSLRCFYVKHFFFKIVTIYCFLCFVGLRPVSCVPNVASVSGLSLVFFVSFFKPSSIFSNVYLHRQDRSNISLKWFVKQLCCISRFANPLVFFSYQNSCWTLVIFLDFNCRHLNQISFTISFYKWEKEMRWIFDT